MWKVDTVRLSVEREKLWVDLLRDLGPTMITFDLSQQPNLHNRGADTDVTVRGHLLCL